MNRRARLWAVIAVTYIATRLIVRIVASGVAHVDGLLLAELAVVPAAQVTALELVARFVWRRALENGDACGS